MRVLDKSARLSHVALVTGDLDASIRFYQEVIGLLPAEIEPDPIRPGCRRSYLCDSKSHRIIELIENPEIRHSTIPGNGAAHHLGLSVDRAGWLRIKTRALQTGSDVRQNGSLLFIRDPDGVVIEIEHGGEPGA